MFARKLDIIMDLLSISNLELSRNAGLDPSYISILRSGKRKLPQHAEFINRFSEYFIERSDKSGRTALLDDLTGAPAFEEKEDRIKYLTNWLESKVNVTDMVSDLLQKISEEEVYQIVEPYIALEEKTHNPDRYYFGIEGRRQANIQVFKEMLESKTPKTHMSYLSLPVPWWTEGYDEDGEYKKLLSQVIQAGNDIEIIVPTFNYSSLLESITAWLPFLMTGRVKPYKLENSVKSDINNTLCLVEDMSAIWSVSVDNGKDDQITSYTRNKQVIETKLNEFNYLKSKSEPIVTTKNEDIILNYRKMFEKINRGGGSFYYSDYYPSFFTQPEEVAKKIDEKHPDMIYLPMYYYARKQFERILENNPVLENTNLLPNHIESAHTQYAGNILEYSREDFILHIKEILRLLKTYPNYNIVFGDLGDNKVSFMTNEDNGVIIEKYNDPQTLFFIKEKEITQGFKIHFLQSYESSQIKGKEETIKYIEDKLVQLEKN